MAKENLKPLEDQTKSSKPGYNPEGDELKVWQQFRLRKAELLTSRGNVYGLNIDAEMRRFDRMYFRRQADIPSSELDPNQKPIAINNAFGKVQAALSILIDRNPEYILNERNPKYSANRELIKQLAQASFKNTNSLGQFKLSVFNAARRGWMIGRTFNRQLIHKARFAKSIDSLGKIKYEERMVTKMDDVMYMNFNNFNTWIDEQTKPEDFLSTRDWMWREVWHIDDVRRTFPEKDFPNMKFVQAGGNTESVINASIDSQISSQESGTLTTSQANNKRGLTELYFYENQYDDWFIIEINGVMVVWEPLPQNNKRLSCVYAPWNLRADDTIYGIGIVEEMERDEELIDRILNMNMRQLLLTIAPMGFYSGTEDFEDENIKIKPGYLRRTMNPKDITFLQIPEGNGKALETVQWIESKQEDKTGISKTLEGALQDSSQTAFEVGVTREAGLKRLRLPLKNFQYALDQEFQNRIALIQQVYSDFQVEHLATDEQIFAYLQEIGEDPAFYFIENEGDPEKEQFFAKKFRQVQMNVEQDEKGNFIESESPKFFHIKPELLAFEGDVTTDMESLLVHSEELEKAETLRMANILVPLLAQPKELVGKPVKQILLAFNKDPKKWLPKDWIDFLAGKPAIEQQQMPMEMQIGDAMMKPELETVVPQNEVEGEPSFSAMAGSAFNQEQ